jgi:hypothetical protein
MQGDGLTKSQERRENNDKQRVALGPGVVGFGESKASLRNWPKGGDYFINPFIHLFNYYLVIFFESNNRLISANY